MKDERCTQPLPTYEGMTRDAHKSVDSCSAFVKIHQEFLQVTSFLDFLNPDHWHKFAEDIESETQQHPQLVTYCSFSAE